MATVTQRPGAPLRLDRENERVWHGEQRLQLTQKAFAVLCYLVDHPGRVVTKEELLRVIWPDTVVSEWALTTCIREIRKALGEAAGAPQYIATVHRRGCHFIGSMRSAESRAAERARSLFRIPQSLQQSKVQSPKLILRIPQSEAEACFLKAIDVACRQQAKSLELRATMRLSRLWQHQGKKEEARHMLAEIYGWFTEGFGTADLQEAKVLLEAL